MVRLNEVLKELFERLEMAASIEDFQSIETELKELLAQLKAINEENDALAEEYGGNFAFVKLYHLYQVKQPNIPTLELKQLTSGLYEVFEPLNADSTTLWLQGRKTFVANLKQLMTKHFIKTQRQRYLTYKVSTWSEDWLNDLYQFLQLSKH